MGNLSIHLAKHLRDLHFGGNWTDVNLKATLADVSLKEAQQKVNSCNSILTLVYHMQYYIEKITPVFEGRALQASDKESFTHPTITSEEDWKAFQSTIWQRVETLANHIEALPEATLWEDFTNAKYGNYYRNIQGIIEHSHYHLGQIVLLKKILRS